MFSVGIIGMGKMGKIRKDAIEKCGHRVRGVVDIDEDPQYILNDRGVEAIFICTPNKFNAPLAIRALQKGKHVFSEKPPALTLKEIKKVADEYKKHPELKLQYGFNHRYHESIEMVKQIVDTERLGKILWMRGRYGKNIDKDFFKGWRAKKELSGGGIVIDQTCHMLDLFLHTVGDFDVVKSLISNSFWNIDGIEDNAFISLRNTKKKIDVSIHGTQIGWRYLFSWEIALEKGYMVINGLKTSSGVYGDEILEISEVKDGVISNGPVEVHQYNVNNSWDREVESFFDSIKNNTPIKNGNIRDAVKLMGLLEKIYKDGKFK